MQRNVTVYGHGRFFTIPYERLLKSWTAELCAEEEDVAQALNCCAVLDVKEMHLPFLKGDIFLGEGDSPASLIVDTYIHAEVWTIINTLLSNVCLK